MAGVVDLIRVIGEDPTREGLADTPRRVVDAWREMCDGYNTDIGELLSRTFPDKSDEMVIVRGIEFVSLCEHHMLPFTGRASVGYVPSIDRVVGLSKIARLVDAFAHRLQVQERLTMQIAAALEEHLAPVGTGVVIAATHSCMSCRGARKAGAEMVTSSLHGVIRYDDKARAEFLRLGAI